jgi:hypothetical protein
MSTLQSKDWVYRILVALITTVLVILGFFFFTVALVAGAIVAAVFGARLWWTLRKLKRAQAEVNGATVVDGDYRIIEHETRVVRLPPE